MRPNRLPGLLGLAIFVTLGASSPAHAWTRTVVQSARATVEVEREATLYVLLRLDVEVHAGWLHELELVDLGPDVELDRYRPPYFRSEEGEVFRPEAELHEDGRIRLWFPRRESPRRGVYRAYIRYRTKADATAVEVQGESRTRIVWSVPAWETGLHDVSVEFRAPKGSVVPAELLDTSPGVDHEIVQRPNRTVLRWRRIHLPRLTAWPLALDAPEGAIVAPSTPASKPAPPGFRPLTIPVKRSVAWGVLLVALFAILKRRRIEIVHGRERLLIRASWPAVLLGVIAVLAAAQWLAPTRLAWCLPLIVVALHRPLTVVGTKGARDLLDVANPFGALLWLAMSGLLFGLGQSAGGLALLPIFLSGTRYHRPPTQAEGARMLATFAAGLRMPADAPPICFSRNAGTEGASWIRLHLATSRSGLLSVGFVPASSFVGLLHKKAVMLGVRTRSQSDADDLMHRRVGDEGVLRAADGSILRLVPWNTEAVELLRALSRKAPKPANSSRGTWLLREISEPRRKAA